MATYVLVPGFWLGAWAWQPVARGLRARGHEVYPVTLTGLGERVHLAGAHVDLETHIADVINLVEFEDLHEVVLVGHSGAGIVVTGAADRMAARIGRLVYVESGPVPDGRAHLDINPPEVQEFIKRQVKEHGDGWRWPMPSWEECETVLHASLAGLDQEQRAQMRARAVAHPFGAISQPLRRESPTRDPLPKVLISCSFPLAQVRQMIAAGHPWFRELAGPEWSFRELPTGHWPMFSVPDDLARLLDDLAAR